MILTVKIERIFKAAAVLLVLKKVYSIPCHDRGYINVMLVLQSCTVQLQVLPGSASESFPTSSNGACNFNNIEVEENIDVKEEHFTVINKVSYIGIKQEEFPEDTTFPDTKAEADEVSYVCVCLLSDTFTSVQKCQLFLCY
jgi:hypothetical protein